LSIDPIILYVTDYTQKNYYYRNDDKEPIMEVFSNDFYEDFIKWCKSRNIAYDVSSIKFGVRLKRLKINGIEKGRHTRKGNSMYLNFDDIKEFLNINNVEDIKEEEEVDEFEEE
jgi:hypothetical protein